ncbi:glutathione peroxidase [Arenibacter sp. BSSL-BM3]|uniref:Glutathione peroxidase n=1 Tax=Arenibacter arenosicollis TaxID=2762274 RepID=A0ABR7QSU4_9FLAO|nr:glutathione peroxidase [Arenibacter arenosicollis]MBC8770025.1 glutathione peroxidase [Arenibacter arenosicollis]
MNPFKIFAATLFSGSKPDEKIDLQTLYEININDLSGKPIHLKAFEGKHILFVNVASKCGFTPQYKELQELHEAYKNKLAVIGFPCNQFGGQEPGKAKDIETFCEVNYGVKFLITEKIEVKGKNQHPLYRWLTNKSINGLKNSTVKWNFQKYLVDDKGNLVDYFFSNTSPMSSKITKHLK